MASLIQGFEYDIFISYRQKDNKYDGWVTKFVADIRKELEATFKEDISVYFDESPHEGLLETHDVSKSLEGKLKCLVFIPIISQTYCDQKSFAWQYEFCAFNKLACSDQFGRDIRISGGNVSSRILPVKINDLDAEDKILLENELGGVLRPIEFIYKEPGVNRPLTPEDDEKRNLNNTRYRNQINKVANATKEIISALKRRSSDSVKENDLSPTSRTELREKADIRSPGVGVLAFLTSKRRLFVFLLTIIISLSGVLVVLKIRERSRGIARPSNTEKTIAVLPFKNLSNDTTQLYFCDGFMDDVLNNLQKVNDFTVRSRTSSDQYRDTKKSSIVIGNELNVNYIVGGSVQREGNNLKIRVQLIDSKADKQIWSNDYIREMKQLFTLQSEIAKDIATELKAVLKPEEIEKIDKKPTDNLDAYDYYLLGNSYLQRSFKFSDTEMAIKMFRKAVESDPKFAMAFVKISQCYLQLHWFHYDNTTDRLDSAKKAIYSAFNIDPDLPEAHMALGNYYYVGYIDYQKAIEQINIAQKKIGINSDLLYVKANIYRRAGNWSLATEFYAKAYELDPGSAVITHNIGVTASVVRQYNIAEEYFAKAIMFNPSFVEAIWQKSFLYLKWKGDTIMARQVLDEGFKYKECISEPLLFESKVMLDIYAGNYQKALSYIASKEIDFIQVQFYVNLKSLLYAKVYALMDKPAVANSYFESARNTLDSMIIRNPEDPRLYSTLGIAYAGMGLKEKAIEAGKRGVEMMPVSREAYRGVFRAEDLARIYVKVGEYNKALEQIESLLKIPSRLSIKLLLLDPDWKPLIDLPEFKKLLEAYS